MSEELILNKSLENKGLEARVADCDKKGNIAMNISLISGLIGLGATYACIIPRLIFKEASPTIPYENNIIFPTVIASGITMASSFITSFFYKMKKNFITNPKPDYFL